MSEQRSIEAQDVARATNRSLAAISATNQSLAVVAVTNARDE